MAHKMIGLRVACVAALSLAMGVFALGRAQADAIADFYRGKTVTVLIGYSAGGGYDLYARLLARHLGRFIPGQPTVLPQNMPGAGSLKVVQYLDSVAPTDGTIIGTFGRTLPIYPLLFPNAHFRGTELNYIGSITTDTSLCIAWSASAIQNWSDLLATPSNFGGEGRGADPDVFATLLAKEFATKIHLITGYGGTADMTLAMERREIDGLCGISYSTLRSAHPDWLPQGKIRILLQAASAKDPALPDAPLLLDLVPSERARLVAKFAVDPQQLARPFAAPPHVPSDRVAALRAAFDAMVKDPEFLADASKSKLDVNPLSGAQAQDIVAALYASPSEVVKEAAQVMGGD